MKISVIGDGGWGTALALVLHRNGHRVCVWGPFSDYIEEIQKKSENPKFLPDISIPPEIHWTSDCEEAVINAGIVLVVIPSKYYRQTLELFTNLIPPSCQILSATKGLDKQTHKRMSKTAQEVLKRESVAVLSGPSHAQEVAKSIPAAVTIASDDPDSAKTLQDTFTHNLFRIYTSEDIIGVELGGALKNVMAIAAGVCDGIGFGDNTKAALLTRGLAEMTRLGCAMGAQPSTFSGLSGMGDLIVTCTSKLSRNRTVGERIGRGESIDEILGPMEQVAEGVWNCRNAKELAQEIGIEVPITDEVYAVVHEGKDPRIAVQSLLARDPRPE
ncbi:MAG: NAD(P)H-dependent glycerol-3-phosphate dehydrogenase [Kiritimatiellae bacterium]|nr:NAD(P)H-dependent glycerol-3-phosphate dehydrogenase [Kiritimatiellia bacterium]